MMARKTFLARLRRSTLGAMAIETALAAPVLLLMSIGAFETSRMVARQSELQSAVAEASQIVLAAMPSSDDQVATIEDVIEASSGLADSKVTLQRVFRCGTDAAYVSASTACANADTVTNYIRIQMTDTFTPRWTDFGVGHAIDFSVDRTVQIS